MILKVHKIIGIIIAIVYGYIFLNTFDVLPGFKVASEFEIDIWRSGLIIIGLTLISLLPFMVIACFLFPKLLCDFVPPKFSLFGEPYDPYSFIWLGYFLLVLDSAFFRI